MWMGRKDIWKIYPWLPSTSLRNQASYILNSLSQPLKDKRAIPSWSNPSIPNTSCLQEC